MAPTHEMSYLFGTGRPWKGPIGSALFVVKRSSEQPVIDVEFSGVPEGSAKAVRFGEFTYGYELKGIEPEPEARLELRETAKWPTDWIVRADGSAPGKAMRRTASRKGPAPAAPSKGLLLKFHDRPIPADVFAGLSLKELRLLRNSFFAVHGRIFTDPELVRFFYQFAWYQRRTDFKESDLNAVEARNVRALSDYEAALRKSPDALQADLSRRIDPETLKLLLAGAPAAQPRVSRKRRRASPAALQTAASPWDAPAIPESDSWALRRSVYLELPWGETSRYEGDDGGTPRGPGPFIVDAKGRVVIADLSRQELMMYDPKGALLKEAKVARGVLVGVALDRNGSIYALTRLVLERDRSHGYRIEVYDPELQPVRVIVGPEANAQDDPMYFHPSGMVVDDLIETTKDGSIEIHDGRNTTLLTREGKIGPQSPDNQAPLLLCRSALFVQRERAGAWLRALSFSRLEADGLRSLWRSPAEGAQFYGCSDSHAWVRVEGPPASLYLIGIKDGAVARITAGDAILPEPPDTFRIGMNRWLSPDGVLYEQSKWSETAFRIYKVELLAKKR